MISKNMQYAGLGILVLIGAVCGLMYSINQDLNSDSVVPGLVAKEIFENGNFQFFYPANDPYTFTDIITFHLIPQVISGYDPLALKITAYVMFLLAVIIFSYIVYRYSGTLNALIFAALALNISYAAYKNYITPEFHVGTIIMAGLLFLIFEPMSIKKGLSLRTISGIVLTALIVYSDSIIIATFVVPYIIVYALFYRKKQDARDLPVGLMALFGFATLISKSMFFNDLVKTGASFADPAHVLTINLPYIIKGMSILTNQGLYNILEGTVNPIDIVLAILTIMLLYIASIRAVDVLRTIKQANKIKGKGKEKEKEERMEANYPLLFFVTSIVTVIGAFTLVNLITDIGSARFLTFTVTSIFALIALLYKDDMSDRVNAASAGIIAVLIISTIFANVLMISSMDFNPNQDEYEFIGYLKANNVTYAYSNFAHANVISYLSQDEVIVRPVFVYQDRFVLFPWLVTTKWYSEESLHGPYAVIVDNSDAPIKGSCNVLPKEHVERLFHEYPVDEILEYKDRTIYIYRE